MTTPAPPQFTLAIVATRDGFIARAPDHPPQDWASAEEQALFFRDVEAADWAIMGRNTHLAADRPERRRIVLSRSRAGWQRPTQLWLDPGGTTPDDLPALVEAVHPLRRGLILGGTTVHDWFLAHGAIHRVHLTIEPIDFVQGLPIFSGAEGAPRAVLEGAGFQTVSEERLNAAGTRYLVMEPRPCHSPP
ncbi:dihydrofolate reductase family protein [Oceanibium sediminis]|uniref:dihydrofolate reductase family protein n=1 Tax=Oceanibium sediminis TaxID=2026339 RepID=UPI001300249C|nr:dihydrofolate reductase family protein [Oceanibium sediminis]